MTKSVRNELMYIGQNSLRLNRVLEYIIEKTSPDTLLGIQSDGTFLCTPADFLYGHCMAIWLWFGLYPKKDGTYLFRFPMQNRETWKQTLEKIEDDGKNRMRTLLKEHGCDIPAIESTYYPCIRYTKCSFFTPDSCPENVDRKWLRSAIDKTVKHWANLLDHMTNYAEDRACYMLTPSMLRQVCPEWDEKDAVAEIIAQYNKTVLRTAIKNINSYKDGTPFIRILEKALWEPDVRFSIERREWIAKNIPESINPKGVPAIAAVTAIKQPRFERAPGNKKPGTFDTIRVMFSLVSKETMPDRNKFLNEHRQELCRIALAKIKASPYMQLPVNMLKIDHIGITCQDQLEFIFSLKDELTEILSEKEEPNGN